MSGQKRISLWFTERYSHTIAGNLFGIVKVPHNRFKKWYHWGFITLFFFLLQCLTGILLSIYYKPTAEDAYSSVRYISEVVEFGSFIRSLHYWCSHLLIASAVISFLSAFFLKAYRKPRETMWYTGFAILLVLFLFAYTGEILPWNELSYFGAAIGISQIEMLPLFGSTAADVLRGSSFLGTAAISRFYVLHSSLLPALAVILIIAQLLKWHVFGPGNNNNESAKVEPVRFYFDFFRQSIIICLSMFLVIMLAAIFYPKGTGSAYDILNPSEAPSGLHPEWYFMWLYQILKADNVIPAIFVQSLLVVIFLFWLLVPNIANKLEAGKSSNILGRIGIILILVFLSLTAWAYFVSGFYTRDLSQNFNSNLGGMDRFSFAAIMFFPIVFMIMILYIKGKNRRNAQH